MRLTLILAFSCVCSAACNTYEPAPLPRGMLALEGRVEEEAPPQGWLGIDVAPNESASLEDLEIMPGVRILTVASGSPADASGLRPGDVLLEFAGTPVNDPGRLAVLLGGVREPQQVELRIQRGSAVKAYAVALEVREAAGGRTLYHVERVRLRVAFRDAGGSGAFPEVVELAPDSPLREVGVEVGDQVLSFQDKDPGSAGELVRRIGLELEPGDPATMRIRAQDGSTKRVSFRAWNPGRIRTGASIWPLYSWSWKPVEDREALVIGDFFLFSLFKNERLGTENRYSILSIISWKTGEPLLESSIFPGAGGASQ
ncbi:MAG TPA: PDZ domain-containing protein [Planctomycetota bacterium]